VFSGLEAKTPETAYSTTSAMLQSTSSGTELLLRSQRRLSPIARTRKSKITMMVAAGLLVLVVVSVVLGVALKPRSEKQIDFGLEHAAMARLALANFTFNVSSPVPQGYAASLAALLSNNSILLGFVAGKGNATKTVFDAGDYEELDKI
ncbi:unnamed protein product, partial [Ixodes persulcatus]